MRPRIVGGHPDALPQSAHWRRILRSPWDRAGGRVELEGLASLRGDGLQSSENLEHRNEQQAARLELERPKLKAGGHGHDMRMLGIESAEHLMGRLDCILEDQLKIEGASFSCTKD